MIFVYIKKHLLTRKNRALLGALLKETQMYLLVTRERIENRDISKYSYISRLCPWDSVQYSLYKQKITTDKKSKSKHI
jgi:hypothetical protein